jgi:hypothetical protein
VGRLWGLDPARPVPTSVTLGLGTVPRVLERLQRWWQLCPASRVKLKLGSPEGVGHDQALVLAVNDALGERRQSTGQAVELQVDANGGWDLDGARAMVVAAEALGSKADGPRLEAVHLLGTAIGANSDWKSLTARVDGKVYNYHSGHDAVLKWLYTAAQGGQKAAGHTGFTKVVPKLENVDVSDTVESHDEYYDKVTLR